MKKRIDLRFLYLLIPLLLLECFFRFVQYDSLDCFTIIRIVLFELFFSLLISFICTRFKSRKVYFVVGLIIVIWFSIYSFLELIFKNYMGDYYSFGTVGDGLTRIAQFAFIFISNAKLKYYLCLLPIAIYLFLQLKIRFNGCGPYQIPAIFCILSFLILLPFLNINSGNISLLQTYATFSNKDVLVDKLGITHFFFRDITALGFKAPQQIIIEEVDDNKEDVVEDLNRVIDDYQWKNIMSKEENNNIKAIDNYLISKSITPKNEMSGIFENYNFIYFLVESGDYLMIDKDLTPNLYKLYNQGITFDNHYTPLYSCATGESEFVSYASVFPYVNTCTPNYCESTYFYNALPWLFKNKGYTTFGIHNWRDEWYDRNEILLHMGIEDYYDIDDIWQDSSIVHTNGWQSDEMLIEQAWKHISQIQGKYMAMIITSTMHFPYNESSYWGDYYLEEINAVHPDWSIDFKRYMSKSMCFDRGIAYLLNELESSGQLDNTVLCLYADHRPYWLDYDKMIDYTSWINDRSAYQDFGDGKEERIGVYRSPFIIYNSQFGKLVNSNYCSTLDHVPTIANLFNLNYDPRLYMGSDIFNGNNTIIFTNGDWLNEKGIYDASVEKFTPSLGEQMPDSTYIESINKQVQNQINVSHLILDEDYFEKRKAVCYPNYE